MTNEIKRVFILEDNERFDTRSAEGYGARIYLNPSSTPFTPVEFMEEVISSLDKYHYNSAVDYILMAGPVQALALYVGTVMAEYAPVNLLLYHAPTAMYQVKVIPDRYPSASLKEPEEKV